MLKSLTISQCSVFDPQQGTKPNFWHILWLCRAIFLNPEMRSLSCDAACTNIYRNLFALCGALRWNNYFHAVPFGVINYFLGVVASIRQQRRSFYSPDKIDSLFAINSGAFCDKHSDRHTKRIHGKVNFCVEYPFVRLIS